MASEIVDKVKFLTYYYVTVGWTCDFATIIKVTDLTECEITHLCEGWDTLYHKFVLKSEENNNNNEDIAASITTCFYSLDE
jgi:hypothetical protein